MPQRAMMPDANAIQALVCLDSPEHQEVCQQMLQALGYTADVMPNQFKALEYLRVCPTFYTWRFCQGWVARSATRAL
jgi:hypothetical protein